MTMSNTSKATWLLIGQISNYKDVFFQAVIHRANRVLKFEQYEQKIHLASDWSVNQKMGKYDLQGRKLK